MERVQLDRSLVLVHGASPDLEWIEIDGELIVWNGVSGELHHLDRTASLILGHCDGSSTLDEVVDELAEMFAGTRATIERDVLTCARLLLDIGVVKSRPSS